MLSDIYQRRAGTGRFKSGGTVVAPKLVNDSNVITAFIRNVGALLAV